MYYATFHPQHLRFYAADGTDLGTWLDRSASERHCKVLDTGKPDGFDVGYIQYVNFTATGDPILAFRTDGSERMAVWTGSDWSLGDGPRCPSSDGSDTIFDIERTGPQSFRLYLGHDEGIQVFESEDGGQRWKAGDVIRVPVPIRRAVVIDNYLDPLRLLLTEATDWSSFKTDRDVLVAGQTS